jgi:hypothetical protein
LWPSGFSSPHCVDLLFIGAEALYALDVFTNDVSLHNFGDCIVKSRENLPEEPRENPQSLCQ